MKKQNVIASITKVDVYVQHLGWAQSFTDGSGAKRWRLHNPPLVWKAIKDAVLATGGAEAVAKLANGAKLQPADSKFSWLKARMGGEAIAHLSQNLEALGRAQGLPAELPSLELPFTPDEIAEMVEMLDTLEEAGDADSAIGLYEGMSQEQQAQIVTARHAPPVCSVCGAEAPGLLCDGVVGAGTCDKPLCKDCSTSQIFMACTRGGGGAEIDTKDYCPECANARKERPK